MALCPYCEQKLPPGVIGLGRTLTAAGGAISLTGTHLTVDGQSVSLGPTQAELLRVLLLRFERWIPTEVLHAALYAHLPEDRSEGNVSVQVCNLRAKLRAGRLVVDGRPGVGEYRARLLTTGTDPRPVYGQGRRSVLRAIAELGANATNQQIAGHAGVMSNGVGSCISQIKQLGWIYIKPGPRRGNRAGRRILITKKGRAILLAQPL